MANYAYIMVAVAQPRATKSKRIEVFEPILKAAVEKALDKRWIVEKAPFEHDGPTWLVTLPKTGFLDPREAMQRLLAQGQDVGFPVSVTPKSIVFRHGPNMFEGWAQGRVEEELADHYKRGVFFDATNRTQKHGTRTYRVGTTYQDYLTRNFDKPLSKDDEAYINNYKRLAPEGHW